MNALRHLKRIVARKTMKANGLTQVCKYGFFRSNWRRFL